MLKDKSLEELKSLKNEVEKEINSRLSLEERFNEIIKSNTYGCCGSLFDDYVGCQGYRFYDVKYSEIIEGITSWDEEDGFYYSFTAEAFADKHGIETREDIEKFKEKIMKECVKCGFSGEKEVY